jgi:methyl-accepting chemotaxis protein
MNQLYQLPNDMVIVSRADLQGNITSFNQAFEDASGYTSAELMGKPHSILRHPDMPKEAFQDLWQTLSAGHAWHGMVKNKRKNGDYYWVFANASPIIEQDQIVGYVSVRYPATAQQINSAEALYAEIRNGRQAMPWTKQDTRTPVLTAVAGFLALTPALAVFADIGQTGLLIVSTIGITAAAFNWYQVRRFFSPDQQQKNAIQALTKGDYHDPVEGNSPWTDALNVIRTRIAESAAYQYDSSKLALRLTAALQTASTNIMVADNNFTIISINHTLDKMFRRNERKLQAVLPQFQVDKLVGSSMDIFHRNPAHQRGLLQGLTQSFETELKISGLVIRLIAVPIIDKAGNRHGYVVEWFDRTDQANIVNDIERVARGIRAGNFDLRVEAETQVKYYNDIKEELNGALANLSDVVESMVSVVEAQAMGDLTTELKSGKFHGKLHDLKNAINYSSTRVRESIQQSVQATNAVNLAAQNINKGAVNLSSRVQQQAAALEESSAALTQITATVQSNASGAHRAASLAHAAEKEVSVSVGVMQETISAIQSIAESSSQIADIVNIIDGIAFQTNLLALNAAVEAARAGDHGRGFAVVAGEVRALAQKSASAAKDIKELITDSITRVERGTQLAERSGGMLNGVTHAIEQVSEMVDQISEASKEQAIGIEQVHRAIADIDRVTQENARLVDETTDTANSLMEEARQLQDNISFFKVG